MNWCGDKSFLYDLFSKEIQGRVIVIEAGMRPNFVLCTVNTNQKLPNHEYMYKQV